MEDYPVSYVDEALHKPYHSDDEPAPAGTYNNHCL
jgi:hypothetical protein